MEYKRGRLAAAVLPANVNTKVYDVTNGMDASIDILINNAVSGAQKYATIDVAIVDGEASAIAAEDYILKGFRLGFGKTHRIYGLTINSNENVVIKSDLAGVNVRITGSEMDAADASAPAMRILTLPSQTLAIADFTDNENATGYIDFTTDLPAGSIVLGWTAEIEDGFIGDTTAIFMVGVEGDTDAFSADVTQSCFTDDSVAGSAPLPATANLAIAEAVTPRVTVTGGANFGDISAGSMVVYIHYMTNKI